MFRYLLLIVGSLVLSGCMSPVVVDYAVEHPFKGYETYYLKEPEAANGLDERRLAKALDSALRAEGLEPATAEAADLRVEYRLETIQKVEQHGTRLHFGLFHSFYGLGASHGGYIRNIEERRIVVSLVDRATGAVVWEATSRDNLRLGMEPQARRELINELVQAMFERFPPA